MKIVKIPKNGRYFVTVFPYADAQICYPQCVHKQTIRAVKMAKNKLPNSGGNRLLCAVDGKLYGYMAGNLDIFLYGDFDFDEMMDKIIDFSETWEIDKA